MPVAGYNPEELAAYLAQIRGQQTGSIDDPQANFTNFNAGTGPGVFDVRSDEERLADDVAAERQTLAASAENEQLAKQKNTVTAASIDSLNTMDSLRQYHSRIDHELSQKIAADNKAVNQEVGIPMLDMAMEAFIETHNDYVTRPEYQTLYNQRQVAIAEANRKKLDLEPSYEESRYTLKQVEDKMAFVKPTEDALRKIEANTSVQRLGAEGELGITRIERELTARSYGIPVADVTAAHYKDMGENRINFQSKYASGQIFTAAEVVTYHPESKDDFLTWEASKNSIETTEKQSVINEWDTKATDNARKVTLTKDERESFTAANMSAKDQQIQLETKKLNERIRTIETEKRVYKKENIKLKNLSLDGTENSQRMIADSNTASATITKYLNGRSILDLSQFEIFTLNIMIQEDPRINSNAVKLTRKMIENLRDTFNAENGISVGVYLTTDELAAWSINP